MGADQHGAATIASAALLAAIIYVARDTLPNPNEGITNLYAIPIAMLAVRFGTVGGGIAALMSLGLFVSWELQNDDITVSAVGYVTRGAAFLVLGLIVGRFANQRRVLVQRLEALAATDPLTGLANRARFHAEFTAELARCRRHERPAALLLADLDSFKKINDTLGHRAGDEVLKLVAGILRENARPTDLVARIGGDEFVVLLPDATEGDAEATARRLRELVAGHVGSVDGEPITVGLSVGFVCFDGRTQGSPDDLMHLADEAMYRAKRRPPRRALSAAERGRLVVARAAGVSAA